MEKNQKDNNIAQGNKDGTNLKNLGQTFQDKLTVRQLLYKEKKVEMAC